MVYEPEYAAGQIIVFYAGDVNMDFAKRFGSKIGLTLLDVETPYGNCSFIYKCVPGEEQESIDKLMAYKEFIHFADRRDLKIETRWETLENVIGMIEDLNQNVELSDSDYDNRIDGIVKYLNGSKSTQSVSSSNRES